MKLNHLRNASLLALSVALASCGQQQAALSTTSAQSGSASLQAQNLNLPAAVTQSETPELWFVEFSEKPTSKGGNSAALGQQKKLFRQQAAAEGVKFNERLSFDRLWNGISVRVLPSDLGKIKDMDGVKAVYPVMSIPIPQDLAVNEPDMATAISQTGADVARNEMGLTGKGVKIAIMDTGLDLDHPAFKDQQGKSRVVASYDLVGDAFNGSNTPVPGQDTVDDCAGHGTHVAGIAAAAGDLPGVAPEASLGVYRVFGCTGSTSSDIMIQAMERVLADGMDVLNMSIGASFNSWPEYPSAVAASNLVDAGVVVAASIGNSGSGGVWAAGAPGVGDKVIGVANFMNTHTALPAFSVSPDGQKVGYSMATGAPAAPATGSLPLAKTGTPTTADDACTPLPANSLAGKAVLIRRGSCSFYVKAFNAQQAGAAAVVVYNNAAGIINPTVEGTPPVTIPVVSITAADGAMLNARIAAGTTTLTWTSQSVTSSNGSAANTLDPSSSYGMSAKLDLKPDLGAPGGMIRSTWPLSLIPSGYNTISGTSMASPHVAGVIALVIEAKRKAGQTIRAEDMRTLLQNTAQPKLWTGNPAAGILEAVHRQGAGMVNVVNAVTTKATVTPSKLSLGESSNLTPQTLTINNSGNTPVTYTLSQQGALTTTGNYTPKYYGSGNSASFSSNTVTVPAGSSATVTVTITPGAPDLAVYGGYVVLTPSDNSPTLRVPYAGFNGDYQALKIFTITPDVARRNADGTYSNTSDLTFTMRDNDYPYFRVHLDHFARWLKMDVLDAKTMQPVNSQFFNAATEEYLPRSSTAGGFFAFGWDGQVSWSRGKSDNAQNKRKPIPNGQYVVKFTALKALGDASNPAHVETWTSPVLTVNAPKK